MVERLRRTLQGYEDALIAAVPAILLVAQGWTVALPIRDHVAITVGAVVLFGALMHRVRAPLLVVGVVLAGVALGSLMSTRILDLEAFAIVIPLVIYNAAAHTGGHRSVLAGVAFVVFGLSALFGDPDGVNLGGIIFFSLLFGSPWVAGRVVRRRRLNEARLEHERDVAHAAIIDERARIARELHDVVAHAISVIVLQARGGRRLLDTEPDQTRGALDAIEHTGRQALVEMRRLVGMLREDEGAIALAPHPGLAHLDGLLERVRAAGLPVDLQIDGTSTELPPGVDLSAFRIVQEALTNALKHAGPARVIVRLRYQPDALGIDITDDGVGAAMTRGDGHGLAGIRERVAVYGGNLDAGPGSEGGYEVRVHLPLASGR